MKGKYVLILLLGYVFSGIAYAEETAFWLTGIIKTDKVKIALVEFRNGKHGYFREGDDFGGGKLLEISDDWMKIEFPTGKTSTFYLNGASLPQGQFSSSNEHETVTLEVGPDYARAELAKALKKESADKKGRLAQDVNRILGVPAQAKIELVDGQPFNSAQMLVELLQGSLNNGGGILLSVSGMPNGADTIYLMAHPDP